MGHLKDSCRPALGFGQGKSLRVRRKHLEHESQEAFRDSDSGGGPVVGDPHRAARDGRGPGHGRGLNLYRAKHSQEYGARLSQTQPTQNRPPASRQVVNTATAWSICQKRLGPEATPERILEESRIIYESTETG